MKAKKQAAPPDGKPHLVEKSGASGQQHQNSVNQNLQEHPNSKTRAFKVKFILENGVSKLHI